MCVWTAVVVSYTLRTVRRELKKKKKKKKKIPFEGMKQPRTVDHLARGSMKTAANCASSCNPQVMRTSTSRTHIAALVTKESWATPV